MIDSVIAKFLLNVDVALHKNNFSIDCDIVFFGTPGLASCLACSKGHEHRWLALNCLQWNRSTSALTLDSMEPNSRALYTPFVQHVIFAQQEQVAC